MYLSIYQQCIFMLRIIVATACGLCIGLERESNLKLAGIRTYSIVAMTSSLMMVISKYGFSDLPSQGDPSRIAAGVVSAVGFLGAGVIFVRKMNISGLVTAAGIWATVGIGSSIGAGLYLLGIASTGLFLLLQFCCHKLPNISKTPTVERIVIVIEESEDIDSLLHRIFTEKKIKISNVTASRLPDKKINVELYVKFPFKYNVSELISLLRETPEIITIDI